MRTPILFLLSIFLAPAAWPLSKVAPDFRPAEESEVEGNPANEEDMPVFCEYKKLMKVATAKEAKACSNEVRSLVKRAAYWKAQFASEGQAVKGCAHFDKKLKELAGDFEEARAACRGPGYAYSEEEEAEGMFYADVATQPWDADPKQAADCQSKLLAVRVRANNQTIPKHKAKGFKDPYTAEDLRQKLVVEAANAEADFRRIKNQKVPLLASRRNVSDIKSNRCYQFAEDSVATLKQAEAAYGNSGAVHFFTILRDSADSELNSAKAAEKPARREAADPLEERLKASDAL